MPEGDRRESKREKEREADIASTEESLQTGGKERGREKRGREEERKRGRDVGTQPAHAAISPAPTPSRLAQPP
jgi:hypothetical protein